MTQPSVGEQLKRARTELQASVKDVVQATKIQPWVLEALEADRLHTTMSPVYVKSFLMIYAKFLRLEPHGLIAQLFPAPSQDAVPASPAVSAPRSGDAPPSMTSVAPGASSLSQGERWQAVVEWLGPPLRRLVPVAVGLACAAGLVLLKPLRWLPVRTPQKLASFSLVHKPPPPPAMESVPHLEPAQPLELGIVAHKPTWVSVTADGKLIAQQQLNPGEQETWRARRRFEVIVGTPSKVDITLNGRSISPLAMAHHGRLVITRSAIKPLEALPTSGRSRPAQTASSH